MTGRLTGGFGGLSCDLKQDLNYLLEEIEIQTSCVFSALIRELPCQLLIIKLVCPIQSISDLLQIRMIKYKYF